MKIEISLHRQSGFFQNSFGRGSPLSVFFNKIKVGSIKTGETKTILLPDTVGILQVGFTQADSGLDLPNSKESKQASNCLVISPECRIEAADAGCTFETGTNEWVNFDFFSLSYIAFFSRRVLFVRKSVADE
jgi:hypothetical protein